MNALHVLPPEDSSSSLPVKLYSDIRIGTAQQAKKKENESIFHGILHHFLPHPFLSRAEEKINC
jgi:hypothetical protein